jgi:hypothetical protein
MQYEITIQACIFLSTLQRMQSRLHRFLQLFYLFECGNAQNTMNITGSWYELEKSNMYIK